MSWYVASQSFLFSAFAVACNVGQHFWWLRRWFIPSVGIGVSLLIGASIYAGLLAMRILRKAETELRHALPDLNRISPMPQWLHILGMAAPALLPIAFIISWIVVLACVPF
jgi:hypothetical protein